jgi:hypothetical protein
LQEWPFWRSVLPQEACTPNTTAFRADALQHFQEGVQSYVTLHRQIERLLPPLDISSEPRKIQQWSDALALELVAGRLGAREGDIIDPSAAAVFRAHIRTTLGDRGRATVPASAGSWDGEEIAPAVNGRIHWPCGSYMPASLIAVLPALPPELQYRFIGSDLVLIDIGAGLVVDVLRDALPPVSTTV